MRFCPFCSQEVGHKKLSTRIDRNFGYICFLSWVAIVGTSMTQRYISNELVDLNYIFSIGIPALFSVFLLVFGGLMLISFLEKEDR